MDLSNSTLVLSRSVKNQHFPFFPSFVNYILQNAHPEILLKFYQCCKYFHFKLKITIASDVLFNFVKYPNDKEIMFAFHDKTQNNPYRSYPNTEKLWLTDRLFVLFPRGPTFNYGLIGEEFLNKIYRNNIKKLWISSGHTLFNELKILCKSPNLGDVELITSVRNENGNLIPIEEIMILLPNIKEFKIWTPHFTMDSFNKLLKFKFLNKFRVLKFLLIETEFDSISLCKFLESSFENGAAFHFTFNWNVANLELRLLPRVKEIINGWKTTKPKCYF